MAPEKEDPRPPDLTLASDGVLRELLRMADLAPSKHTADFLRLVYAKERLKGLFQTSQ